MFSKGIKTKAKITSINSMLMTITSQKKMSVRQVLKLNNKSLGMVEEVKKGAGREFIYKTIYDSTKEKFSIGQSIDVLAVDMEISIKSDFFGSIIDPSGNIRHKYKGEHLDDLQKIVRKKSQIFGEEQSISKRENVLKPLETGMPSVDAFNTLSQGQRLAIVGKSKTGKSHLASSLFINPSKIDKDIYLVYAFIGETHETVSQIREHLALNKSVKRSILIHSNPASKIEQYLAPYVAMAMAENLSKAGKDVIVVLDNMTTHAKVCSEIAILNERPVGRDMMPGDIFHVQASLLERGGNFKNGGSISVIPLIHVDQEDFSSVVASNIISITDGQILLDSKMAASKKFPAINLGRSISRIGYATMPSNFVSVAKSVAGFYYKYLGLKEIYGNSSASHNPSVEKVLRKGKTLENLLTFSLAQRNTFNLEVEMMFLKFIDWSWNDLFDPSNNLLITSFIWMSMYDRLIKKQMKRLKVGSINWPALKLYIENKFISISRYYDRQNNKISEWSNKKNNDYSVGYDEDTLETLFKWLNKVQDKSIGGWEYGF